jgi:hypothetical protein
MASGSDSGFLPIHDGKRKRDQDAQRIIDEFEARRLSGGLSPDTERIAQNLAERAGRTIENGDDQGALLCGWKAFIKTADKSQTAREVREDCEAKIVRLEEEAKKARKAFKKTQAELEATKEELEASQRPKR